MGTLNAYSQLTLLELAKRTDPQGDTAQIVEVLNAENEILLDAVWLQANDTWAHKTTRRITLPQGTWRQINAGVPGEASRTQEIVEGIGMLESYAENDKALVDSAPTPESFRNSENMAFIEGLSQTLASAVMYSNSTTDTSKFDGFATRMGSLAATQNVIGQGGTGDDNTSVYVVIWGPNKVHMIYPKGHRSVGVEHRDLGEDTKVDSNGNMWQIYRDWFGIYCGIVVRDDRCIARLANIEVTGTTNILDEDNLIKLLNRMPGSGRNAVLYVNDTIQSQAEIALKDKTNVNFTPGRGEGLAGEPVVRFRGCPIRKVDAIINTELTIS